MSEPLTLWLPAPPDNANARQHWAAANRAKKRYWAQLDQHRHAKLLPPPPRDPIARAEVRVEWHYPDGRWHIDPDNALRRLKPATDYLVSHGYLAGDTATHLRWLPLEECVGGETPPCSTVRLTLTPLSTSPEAR